MLTVYARLLLSKEPARSTRSMAIRLNSALAEKMRVI
jgi:hypothetical protein